MYAVDIGLTRLSRAPAVFKVLGGDLSKLQIVQGTFSNIKLPDESVDCIVMNGSFHHCYEPEARAFIREASRALKDSGAVMLSNEHFVDWVWCYKRALGAIVRERRLVLPSKKIRRPDASSGEHCRTRREVLDILHADHLFDVLLEETDLFYPYQTNFIMRAGWHFYSALLTKK